MMKKRENHGMIYDFLKKPIIILGCGNILFGDDGFGPAVVEYLENHYSLPETVLLQDMGTSIQEFLFDLTIAPYKPKRVIIIDALSQEGRVPGELFEIDLSQFPQNKISSRPIHQFPSVNQIQELAGLTGTQFRILVVQSQFLPENVSPGLSQTVQAAVPLACDWLMKEIGNEVLSDLNPK
jgi:coenzyme F420 hydrogenase subunit delta